MVEIDLASLIITGVAAAIFSFIGSFLMWSIIGPRVVKKGIGKELGPAMITWLFEPSIDTGETVIEKIERADGSIKEKESKEIIAPAEELARRMGKIIYSMTLSKLGVDGHKKAALIGDVQSALANPDNPLSQYLGAINPKIIDRALKDGDYIPLIIQLLMSNKTAQEFVTGKLNKGLKQSKPAGDGVSQWMQPK